MTRYEAYVLYCALKRHFTSNSYDFLKYNGKVKVNAEAFETRNDRFLFEKLAKHPDPKNLIISNLLVNDKFWVGDAIAGESVWVDWKRRTQALGYNFEEDLKKLLTNLDDNVIIKSSDHPYLLKMFMRKKVSIETLVILEDLLGFFKHWNQKLKGDIMWEDIHLKCVKYRPFLHYERKKMKGIALKVFEPEPMEA
jgi:hypothetical protein